MGRYSYPQNLKTTDKLIASGFRQKAVPILLRQSLDKCADGRLACLDKKTTYGFAPSSFSLPIWMDQTRCQAGERLLPSDADRSEDFQCMVLKGL